MTPIFELKDYFFPVFNYRLNMEYDKNKRKDPQIDVVANITNFVDNLWGVSLVIKTPDNMEKETFLYEFYIQISGVIESVCPPEVAPLAHKRLLYVNGASLLYSTARDRLFLFSDRLAGRYLLPAYRFDPCDIEETDVTEETVIKRKKTTMKPKKKIKKSEE